MVILLLDDSKIEGVTNARLKGRYVRQTKDATFHFLKQSNCLILALTVKDSKFN